MASTSNNAIEGHSINKPPFFYGNNYTYWKCRMIIYLKSINFKLWDIIINGFPKMINLIVNGVKKMKD